MIIKSDATWSQAYLLLLKEDFREISQGKPSKVFLIIYSMLPLPFPIYFSLSFVTPWVSSLPYLPEWVWASKRSHHVTPPWYIPFYPRHYQIESSYYCKGLFSIVCNITCKRDNKWYETEQFSTSSQKWTAKNQGKKIWEFSKQVCLSFVWYLQDFVQ